METKAEPHFTLPQSSVTPESFRKSTTDGSKYTLVTHMEDIRDLPNDNGSWSSLWVQPASFGDSKDENLDCDDSDSNPDSLPDRLKGVKFPPPPACSTPGSTVPEEYLLKLSSEYSYNLASIRKERDEVLQRWEKAKETNASLAEALRIEKAKRARLEEVFERYKSTEIVRLPTWPLRLPLTPPPSAKKASCEKGEIITADQPYEYLYDNPLYQGYELNINIILLRIGTLIDNNCPGKATELIEEALEKARKLKYEPIHAKCLYWKGRILHLQGRRQEAAQTFLDASPCIGKYKEGEALKRWQMKYEDDIEKLSNKREGSSMTAFVVGRKRPMRNACVSAAELPPTP